MNAFLINNRVELNVFYVTHQKVGQTFWIVMMATISYSYKHEIIGNWHFISVTLWDSLYTQNNFNKLVSLLYKFKFIFELKFIILKEQKVYN